MLQSVAMYCSALQCVAVRCSVLQCVAVCCSALTWVDIDIEDGWDVAGDTSVSHCVAVFSTVLSVLQCVAVCVAVCLSVYCGVLQCNRVWLGI